MDKKVIPIKLRVVYFYETKLNHFEIPVPLALERTSLILVNLPILAITMKRRHMFNPAFSPVGN